MLTTDELLNALMNTHLYVDGRQRHIHTLTINHEYL